MYSGMDSYLYDVHDVAISIGMWAFQKVIKNPNVFSMAHAIDMWKIYILYHVPLKQS